MKFIQWILNLFQKPIIIQPVQSKVPFTGALLNRKSTPVSAPSFPVVPNDQVVTNDTALNLPTDDQKQLPICVADDIRQQMQEYWLEKTGVLLDFSRRWIYAKAVQKGLQGLFPEDAYPVVCTEGCPTTLTCPDDVTLPEQVYRNLIVTQEMIDEAKKYIMPAPIAIAPDLQSIRSALPHVGAIGATFEVGDFTNEIIQPPQTPYTALHRMRFGRIAPTYNPNDFIAEIPNSWGKFWGDYGIGFAFWSIWNGHIHDLYAFPKPTKDMQPSTQNTIPAPSSIHPNIIKWCNAIQRYEGWSPTSRSCRNNNPGNIEFDGQANAVLETLPPNSQGETARFAHFTTYEDGYNYLYNLLLKACTGQSHNYEPSETLQEFYAGIPLPNRFGRVIEGYAPSSDGNNTNAYATAMAKALGVTTDTLISSLV